MMYEAELYDKVTKRYFVVKKESPYLLKQWLKKHKLLAKYKDKRLLLVRSDVH